MTEQQQKAILEVCRNLISTGIAFGYQKDRTEPEYPAERGLAEILRVMETEINEANARCVELDAERLGWKARGMEMRAEYLKGKRWG